MRTRFGYLIPANLSFTQANGISLQSLIFVPDRFGVSIGKHHTSTLVFSAVTMALNITNTYPEIFHSDQGTEFMAEKITSFLEGLGTQISASDKASPWQNGYQEFFLEDLKKNLEILTGLKQLESCLRRFTTKSITTTLKESIPA